MMYPQSEIGQLLSSSYELTLCILNKLNYHDLLNAMKVCNTWRNIGEKILRKRRFRYFVYHHKNVPTTLKQVILNYPDESLETMFDEFFHKFTDKPTTCLAFSTEEILYNSMFPSQKNTDILLADRLKEILPDDCCIQVVAGRGIVGTTECKKNENINEAKLNSQLLKAISEEDIDQFSDTDTKLDTNINDGACSSNDGTSSSNDGACSSNDGADSSKQETLTPSICGSSSDPDSIDVGYSVEVESSEGVKNYLWGHGTTEALSILLIPHHPGVKIKISCIDENEYFKKQERKTHQLHLSPEEFDNIVGIEKEDKLKAYLLFDNHTYEDRSSSSPLLEAAYRREQGKLALGGGIISTMHSPGQKMLNSGSVSVAICGPNVKVASIVLTRKVRNLEMVQTTIEKLKSCNLPEEQSFALMFACCGRGENWYSHYKTNKKRPPVDYFNVESAEFRRQFPKTPIFGFFGEGEYGHNFLKLDDTVECSTPPPKRKRENIYHSFATSIVLVSYL